MRFFNKLAGAGVILTCAAVLSGCSAKQGELLVARIGNNPVTLKEYENLYLKSNGNAGQAAASTQEERERFLELMTKFKLKLADAYDQNLHLRPEIRSEIATYKGSLVASYLTEREVTAPGVKKLYEARKVEMRARHILLSLAPGAAAADSENVYKKAYELIAQLNAGASFESLAVANSNDPSVHQNKGDLYYFTAGRMVPEFEEGAFALNVGQIAQKPVRTQYGVHIIKCVDKKPSSGEIKASHIMIRFPSQDPSPEDTLVAYKKIKLIEDSLMTGKTFAELAMRNSEDPGSAPRGGDLGWFGRARWIQPFDERAFKLRVGEVSEVVRTIYGYHLIRCDDARPPKTFDEARKDIQQLYQQTRFQRDYNVFLDKLKAETRFGMNDSVVNLFAVSFDSLKTTNDSAWASALDQKLGSSTIMRFGARAISCDSVVSIISSRPDMANVPLNSHSIRQQLTKVADQLLFQVKAETIERDYPEFASIMKEYTDGILLYQIEQDRVWGKVVVNDTLLQEFYEANRDKFAWPDRVAIASLSLYSDSLARVVYNRLAAGATLSHVYSEDSARVAQRNSFSAPFAGASATLSPQVLKTLVQVAGEMKADPALRVQLLAQPDTSKNKARALKLADRRLEALKNQLSRKLGVDASRISVVSRPQASNVPDEHKSDIAKNASAVNIALMGRRSWFVGGIDRQLQPVTADERTRKADSLAVGAFSEPFPYRGNFTIVQLERKEPARLKTFEEAGSEVSSAFQDSESKRLEREWLDGLRKRYPVEEYREALKHAFASEK